MLEARRPSPEKSKAIAGFNGKFQEFKNSRISPEEFALDLLECVNGKLDAESVKKLEDISRSHKKIRNIEGVKFFSDFERYVNSVKEKVYRNEEERKLDGRSRKLDLAGRLIFLELSREDWEETRNSAGDLAAIFPGDLKFHFGFYENCEKRDRIFTDQLIFSMEKNKYESAVLISGGFHAQGATGELREKGISYLLIAPEIRSFPDQPHYRDIMKGEVSWKKYFTSENGKIDLCKSFIRGTRDRLLAAVKMDSGNFLKNWRDQIIRDLADRKKLAKARDYTFFIDELGKDELEKKFEKIDKFIEGLRRFDTEGKLNEKNFLQLLRSTAAQPAVLVPHPGSLMSEEILNGEGLAPDILAGAAEIETNPLSELRAESFGVTVEYDESGNVALGPVGLEVRQRLESESKPDFFLTYNAELDSVEISFPEGTSAENQRALGREWRVLKSQEENFLRIIKAVGRPVTIAIHKETLLPDDREVRSFRDSQGRIHLQISDFSGTFYSPLQHLMLAQTILAALAVDAAVLEKILREHTQAGLDDPSLFSFDKSKISGYEPSQVPFLLAFPPDRSEILEAEGGRVVISPWYVDYNNYLSLQVYERLSIIAGEDEKKEMKKRALVEHLGKFISVQLSDANQKKLFSEEEIEIWFPEPAARNAIVRYLTFGAAGEEDIRAASFDDLQRAFHNLLVFIALNSVKETFETKEFTSDPEISRLRTEILRTKTSQNELLRGLIKENKVVFIESEFNDLETLLQLIERNVPNNSLVVFPGFFSKARQTGSMPWESSWATEVDKANEYLRKREKGESLKGKQKTRLLSGFFSSERMDYFQPGFGSQLKNTFRYFRTLNQNGANIRYFPDFESELLPKSSDDGRFNEGLETYAQILADTALNKENNIDHVIFLHGTWYEAGLKEKIKPRRNARNLLLQQLGKYFEGEKISSSYYLSHDPEDRKSAFYEILPSEFISQSSLNTFGLPNPLPKGLLPLPVRRNLAGVTSVLGNFENLFVTIVDDDQRDKNSDDKPVPSP